MRGKTPPNPGTSAGGIFGGDAEPGRPHTLLILGDKELGVPAHRHSSAIWALGELGTELVHDPVRIVSELELETGADAWSCHRYEIRNQL
jgi:hypothetical protein